MFNTRQTLLASRPAAMVLALTLVAALSTPFVMLPHARAATTPLPCTEGNHNGCTELSPTPPEDTVSVPPNIVLMLDDSGSMAWDFMPDWEFLADTSLNGVRDSAAINGLYYNPTVTYTPPPQADGTAYPDSPGITSAYKDGFLDTTHFVDVASYGGNPYDQSDAGARTTFRYYENLTTNTASGPPYPAVLACSGAGYSLVGGTCVYTQPAPVPQRTTYTCNPGDTRSGTTCTHHDPEGGTTTYPATPHTACPGGTTYSAGDGLCHYPATNPNKAPTWQCPSGGSIVPGSSPPMCQKTTTTSAKYFTYVLGPKGSYVQYYVAGATPCSSISSAAERTRCTDPADTSGTAAPSGVAAGQNIANWFSYYSTRLLMAKSGLMTAFAKLDPKYRFGFASINANGVSNIPASPAPYGFDDSSGFYAGSSSNQLAVVQPFGDGSAGTQKALFWNWIANESARNGTPLRKALQAVGEYYKTSQPWSTLPGDPGYTTGSTTQFACRASYAILTTDGFWNGDDPTTPAGIVGAASADGPVQTVPSGDVTQYTAVDPLKGGGAVATSWWGSSTTVASLADVATYYWENDLSSMPNEVSPSKADPAAWQHMTTFTIGLGFTPTGIAPAGTTIPQIFAWSQGGTAIPGFSWPTPTSNSINNIADLAHAAVNGHGDFFSAKDPATFAAAFASAISDISARTVKPTSAAVNASVLSQGAVSFSTGYSTKDWTGAFEAVTLKPDGTLDQALWLNGNDPAHPSLVSQLDAAYHSAAGYTSRNVFTDSYKVAGTTVTFSAFQFNVANEASLDGTQTAGLQTPALSGTNDTLDHRIEYLLGDTTFEDGTTYRTRSSVLGAILRATPVYVAGATGNYYDSWPTFGTFTPPETASGAQTYDAFTTWASTRLGTAYMGANDGMLHAFNAPVPTCSSFDASTGTCSTTWALGANFGKEDWAFIPRAVYANLGNLTAAANFQFRRTVDATPVTRDVFFSEGGAGNNKWHTILAGGVGLGGRGVYALDITDPTVPDFNEQPMTKYPASGVLWEFDSDMADKATGCVSIMGSSATGSCKASDLGFTVSQPNVGRLSNGKWVVLVPNGYFPDCNTPDIPTNPAAVPSDPASCQAIAAQAPKDSSGNPYSALFVLDAETGKMLAELKTPTDISGVTSFGLATPVLGDYQNDQVDDVAFAGDVQGNLWRFDLSSTDATGWKVTLVYKGISATGADGVAHQGVQPITTMPRLFPDPTTNRFMVLFGTGKFLGVGDNSDADQQALYAVRDQGGSATSAMAWSQSDLAQRYLHETSLTMPDGSVATLRCVTGASTDACDTTPSAAGVGAVGTGGWFINLHTTTSDGTTNDAGERVVVNPGAIFSSNTVVFETLITGAQSTDACNPSTQGSILTLNAVTGGSAGASSLGGGNIAGGRINNARTSGSLPIVSALGGGQAYLPGMTLAPAGKNPISIDAPIWRRRSWHEINQNQ